MINKIDKWYENKCDGYWEHNFGIKFYTTDNPGWVASLDIDRSTHDLETSDLRKICHWQMDEEFTVHMSNGEIHIHADTLEVCVSAVSKILSELESL